MKGSEPGKAASEPPAFDNILVNEEDQVQGHRQEHGKEVLSAL